MSGYLPVFTSPEGERATMAAYEEVLACWDADVEELDVPTRFGMTHVIASGPTDAPVLVLLHAYFATAMSWYRAVGPLSASFRVLAVDVLGDANRSRPTRPIASLDDSAAWFTDLLDGLGAQSVHLVGNSFGGFIAVEYARRLPGRVESLALIGPAATFHGMRPFYTHMFAPKAAYLMMPWLPGQTRAMDHAVNWMRAGLPPDPAWEDLFRSVMTHGRSGIRIFPRVYTARELAQVRARTLLILGDHERVYPPDQAAQAARRLMPGIDVQLVADAHHITALSQPERVSEILLRFMADHAN